MAPESVALKGGGLYKFLLAGGRSANGRVTWQVGQWHRVKGVLQLCQNGFHASRQPLDALRYVAGEILCEVEGRGEQLQDTDKEC